MGAGVREQYGMTPFTQTDQQPQGQRNTGKGKHWQFLQTESFRISFQDRSPSGKQI